MEGLKEVLTAIGGAAIAIVPLFITAGLIKTTSAIDNVVGKFKGSAQKGASDFGGGFGDDLNNRRRSAAAAGGGGPLGAVNRYKMRRDAARKSRAGGAAYAETKYIADTAAANGGDNRLANQMAGGDPARKASVVASAVAQQRKAAEEGIKDMEALIRLRIADPNQGDIKNAQDALRDALNKGDSTAALAAQNLLFAQGGSGIGQFREVMQQMEGRTNPDVTQHLKENIQDKHGQYAKGKGTDVLNWANQSGTSLSDTGAGKMSDNDLAGQHISTLSKMVNNNEVTGDQARSMLSDPRVNASLSPDQKKLLAQAAGGDVRPKPSQQELDRAHQEAINENTRRGP